jgi:hypothetical protein
MRDATAYTNWVDGNPDEIASHSLYYAGIAEAVRTTVTNLQTALDTDATVSDAVAAFSEIAATVASTLGEVDDRYQVVADQLAVFSGELRRIQDLANTTQDYARAAWEDRSLAVASRDSAYFMIGTYVPDDPGALEAEADYRRQCQLVGEYDAVIAARQRELDGLIDEWRAAADECARAINDVVDGSELNDSRWDRIWARIEEVLPVIQLIVDIASMVLTVLAIIAVFTGVGAALAPLLFGISRGLQVLSKAISVVRMLMTCVDVATGRKSPMALVGIGVDAVAGKAGGRAMTGVVNRVGGSRAKDFNEWVADEFADAVARPKGAAPVGSVTTLSDIPMDTVDTVGKRFDTVLDAPATALGLSDNVNGVNAIIDNLVGDPSAASSLAWDITTVGNDVLSTAGVTPNLLSVPDFYGKDMSGAEWGDLWSGTERHPSPEVLVKSL